MNSLELDPLPERVPAEEGGGVGDLPLLDEAVAVEVGRRPVALRQVGRPVVLGEVLVLSQVNVPALVLYPAIQGGFVNRSRYFRQVSSYSPARFGPEEHLEPELFEAVVVVGPARLEDLVPVLVHVQLVRLVQPRQVLNLQI